MLVQNNTNSYLYHILLMEDICTIHNVHIYYQCQKTIFSNMFSYATLLIPHPFDFIFIFVRCNSNNRFI